MYRLIFPVLLGVVGVAILIGLGVWQVQRLTWKEGILAQIDARISDAPVPVPADPREAIDEYLPVAAAGELGSDEIRVLVSVEDVGPSYRIIAPMVLSEGRRILVDRGFVPLAAETELRPGGAATVTGNLLWPDEVDSWTPEPDLGRGIWFARDLPAMAAAMGTEPVLVVARDVSGAVDGVRPLPINTATIPNDHLNYAITWFLLALVWAVMSGILIRGTVRRKD